MSSDDEELINRLERRIKTIDRLAWEDMDNEELWERTTYRIYELKREIENIKLKK